MEALTRMVADSLARHGLDRPVDPRRLLWSHWFRCDSPHSLLVIPSKPGIFALAEEIMDLSAGNAYVGTAAPGCPAELRSAALSTTSTPGASTFREGHDFSRAVLPPRNPTALAAAGIADGAHATEVVRRMLAVLQFFEDEDMAFTLDRMFTRVNPMRSRLASGRCFLRFVVVQDQEQRRSICTALNQWIRASAEKAAALPADFTSSLELTESVARTPSPAPGGLGAGHVERTLPSASSEPANINTGTPLARAVPSAVTGRSTHLDCGAARNLHCPHPLPSGF